MRKPSLMLAFFLLVSIEGYGQKDTIGFWDIPSTLHHGRFWTATAVGTVSYGGALISLNELWYKQYPRTSFHFFNDGKEWLEMDKAGHMFTAYFEAEWTHGVSRWIGMKKSSSILTSTLVAFGLQATIETLDGFSSQWGFSLYDLSSNVAGCSLWAAQQMIWEEQRIRMKVSSTFREYPDELIMGNPSGSTTLKTRTNDVFGKNIFETFLKDYNAQTIWVSVNIHSFLNEESKFPKWLNIAFGYGAENMFGGFENSWKIDDNTYELSKSLNPRYRQLFISPDIDLSKIPIKGRFLKTIVSMANIFKIPAPAIVFNGKGGVKWNWLYY